MGYSPWGHKESGHDWVTGSIRNSQPPLGAVLSSGKECGLASYPHPFGTELWPIVLGIKSSWLPN